MTFIMEHDDKFENTVQYEMSVVDVILSVMVSAAFNCLPFCTPKFPFCEVSINLVGRRIMTAMKKTLIS